MNLSLRAAAVAALSVLALVGCDESRVVGTLTTTSTLRIVSPGGNKQVLNRGSYRTAIRATDKGAQAFITTSGKEVTFKIPQISGSSEQNIQVSAAKMGQEFGVAGRIYRSQVPFDRTVERSCVYARERRLVCRDNRDGDRRREDCDWVTEEIMGEQRVREIGYSAYKNVDINLVNTASQKIGNFRGTYSYGDTVTSTDYLTGCYRSWNSSYLN